MSFQGEYDPLPGQPEGQISSKFVLWNGDGPAPKLSHRTEQGTITIRASLPKSTTEVLWNGEHIGFDVIWVHLVLANLIQKKYDHDFGFAISELVPPELGRWNDL